MLLFIVLINTKKIKGEIGMKFKKRLSIELSAIIIGLISFNTATIVNAQDVQGEPVQVQASSKTEIINIPDKVLKEAINYELGKSDLSSDITKSEIESITKLTGLFQGASGRIISLEGIEYAKNLETLLLDFQILNDISQIKELKGLKKLSLGNAVYGRVVDLSPISELTNLTYLDLSKNSISDLSFINNLTNVTHLDLHSNMSHKIDISQIQSLENLETLRLSNLNNESSKYLSKFTKLKELVMSGCNIEDISMLENLTHMEKLDLQSNNIENISALSNMVNLKSLNLGSNKIVNISTLSNMVNLETLNIEKNKILDLSPLKDLNKISYSSIREQRCKLEEQVVRDNKLVIKNPLIGIYGGQISNLESSNNQKIKFKVDGENLIVEDLTYDKLVSLGFKLTFIYDKRVYPLDMGGVTYSNIEIPIKNTFIKFTDVEGHWAKDDIYEFVENTYIDGYEDGTFRPNNPISRAEFIKLVNKVFKLTKTDLVNFTDVDSRDWYFYDLCVANKAGYIDGYEDGTFRPNNPISREEAAKIIATYKNIKDSTHDKVGNFTDRQDISDWAIDSIEGVVENGYMNGYLEGNISPKNNITRAESVTMLNRIK